MRRSGPAAEVLRRVAGRERNCAGSRGTASGAEGGEYAGHFDAGKRRVGGGRGVLGNNADGRIDPVEGWSARGGVEEIRVCAVERTVNLGAEEPRVIHAELEAAAADPKRPRIAGLD